MESDQPQGNWSKLGSSNVLTAIVTVAATAFFGNYFAEGVQNRTKRNEVALAAFQDNQKSQVELVKETYDLIGQFLAAGDDVIYITSDRFAAERYDAAGAAANRNWFEEVRAHHDEVDQLWRRKRIVTGFLLKYYFEGSPAVQEKWAQLADGLDAFEACVGTQGMLAPGSQAMVPYPCDAERKEAQTRINALTDALGKFTYRQ